MTSQTEDSFLQVFAGKHFRDEGLACRRFLAHAFHVGLPNLDALKTGDASAWDEAFAWLWPAAFAVAKLKLQPYLPNEVEDVAIESIEQLVEKVPGLKSVGELKPLAASIAHHRAVSLLRERFAKKRGEGKTESLDAQAGGGVRQNEPTSSDSPLEDLEQAELAQRLGKSLTELKTPMGEILSDFFIHGLRYEEIAKKRGVAVGSVGVYLKRGLEAMRRIWIREENS
jgi:RNA polymerase sigma factor (sigma-70 family)